MALARALAVDPQVLLLDEPFGALDAKVRADLRQWLRRLHDEVHVTTVLVTHDQEEALDVADRIAVLNKGRIEQVGDPVTLYERPANDFVMSLPRARWRGSAASSCAPTTSCSSATGRGPRRSTPGVPGSPGVVEAVVERVVRLGFEVRVDLRSRRRRAVRGAGHPRRRPTRWALGEGETVYARAARPRRGASRAGARHLTRARRRAWRGLRCADRPRMRAWTSRRARSTPSGPCSSSPRPHAEARARSASRPSPRARTCPASSSRRSSPTCAAPSW